MIDLTKKAKAAVFMGAGKPFEIREYPLTKPAEGMAAVKLTASGICGTDLHFMHGNLGTSVPVILGHEFIGCVEAINDADADEYGIHEGDTVIIDIACPCGECLLCHDGDDANCVHLGVTNGGHPDIAPHFHGGFGEYNYAPVKNLVKVPSDLDAVTTAVFACAGPTTLHAVSLGEKAGNDFSKAETVVIQGLGPVGMFAVAYFASLGIKNIVSVAGRTNPQREKLAKALGATVCYTLDNVNADQIKEKIMEMSNGLGADVVFEGSGAHLAVPQGIDWLRNRGVYLIPGQYSSQGKVEISPERITFAALQLIGSSQYSLCDVARYIDFLETHPDIMPKIRAVASTYSVSDINKAFDDLENGKAVKALLV